MSYHLDFSIAPDLFARAITTPKNGPAPRDRARLQNIAAVILVPSALWCFDLALFRGQALAPLCFGAVCAGAGVLAVWWRQHRTLVAHHKTYNDAAGRQVMQISDAQIVVSRDHIESRIQWPLVRAVHTIEAATLIELPTARLIVPDVALPDGVTPTDFVTQIKDWARA